MMLRAPQDRGANPSRPPLTPERPRPMTRGTPGNKASVVETIVPRTRRQGPLG